MDLVYLFWKKNLGKPKEAYTNLDDCALGDYEGNVLFDKAECISHDVAKTYKLRNMIMTQTNGFKIKNILLNANTTETDFLKMGIGLISDIVIQNNSYAIYIDELSYEFTFKNGKLHKVAIIYYC